jgi:hypothetical protein
MKSMKSILTTLTAGFILLLSSFTFSSCKSCNKEKTKPDCPDTSSRKKVVPDNINPNSDGVSGSKPGDNQAPISGGNVDSQPAAAKPKEELPLEEKESRKLLENVAGWTVGVWYAANKVVDMYIGYIGYDEEEAKKQRDEAKRLAARVREVAKKQEVVKAASSSSNENTKNNALAIVVLLVKAEREEAFAVEGEVMAKYDYSVRDILGICFSASDVTELEEDMKNSKALDSYKKNLLQELINAKKANTRAETAWDKTKSTYVVSSVLEIALKAWNKVGRGAPYNFENPAQGKNKFEH